MRVFHHQDFPVGLYRSHFTIQWKFSIIMQFQLTSPIPLYVHFPVILMEMQVYTKQTHERIIQISLFFPCKFMSSIPRTCPRCEAQYWWKPVTYATTQRTPYVFTHKINAVYLWIQDPTNNALFPPPGFPCISIISFTIQWKIVSMQFQLPDTVVCSLASHIWCIVFTH